MAKSTKRKPAKTSTTKKIKFTLRESSGDLVQIQIAAHIKKAPKGIKITRALLNDMIRRKAKTSRGRWYGNGVRGAVEGVDPKGIYLEITRWRNPSRSRGKRGRGGDEWRTGSQADAWGSLRRILQVI